MECKVSVGSRAWGERMGGDPSLGVDGQGGSVAECGAGGVAVRGRVAVCARE